MYLFICVFIGALKCYLLQTYAITVPCISGSFLTVNNRGRPVCTPCPRGFYKEDEFEIHCSQCPNETSTVEAGSTHLTDCIGKCFRFEL